MSTIFKATIESAYEVGRYGAPAAKWPMAGMRLDADLHNKLGMAADAALPERIGLAGLTEEYTVTPNGYLIPFYPPSQEKMDRSDLSERNEELMIDRARSFVNHAQPELGVLRTKEAIDHSIHIFENMPEQTHLQVDAKVERFKIIAGAIMIRLEMLGRMIYQGNTEGAKTEYNHLTGKKIWDGDNLIDPLNPQPHTQLTLDMDYAPIKHKTPMKPKQPVMLTQQQISLLKKEADNYYRFLTNDKNLPYMRSILLMDQKIDRDGMLIDLVAEMGKGLLINANNEGMIRQNIVFKIGHAMESIDELHDLLEGIMTKEPTASAFATSIKDFIAERGADYDVHSIEDVIGRLHEYAALCRTRAGIRSDDPSYDEVFVRKSVLMGFFNGENGLLQSMRRVGRVSGPEISEMRSLLRDGIKLMERASYTRMGCNHEAPRIWIPQFDSQRPVEQFLIKQFLSPQERKRSREIYEEAKQKFPPNDEDPDQNDKAADQREAMLKPRFCSIGRLRDHIDILKEAMHTKKIEKPADHRTRVASSKGNFTERGAR